MHRGVHGGGGRCGVSSVRSGDVQARDRLGELLAVRGRHLLWGGSDELHAVRGGDILAEPRRRRVLGVPGAHELHGSRQQRADGLHMHRGVHGGGGRLGVSSVRGGDVQACDRLGELLAVRGGDVRACGRYYIDKDRPLLEDH